MTDVFISYSRRDQDFARHLFDALEKQGLNAWIDWDDIPLTADWWREIQRGIESADTFVFIITPDSVTSEVCRNEIQHAIDNNKRFVPILHRDIVDEAHKSVMHSAISSHNWLYFREADAFENALQNLQNVLSSDLGYIRAHTRLVVRAQEWREKDRDPSYVLQGSDLGQAESWLASSAGKVPTPTPLQSEYIFASRGRANRRGRLLMAAAAVVVMLTAALAIFAISESRETQKQREIAENNRATSQANEALAVEAASTSVAAAQTSDANEALAVSSAKTAEYRADVLDSLQSASDADLALQKDDWALALERAQNANVSANPPEAQRILGEVAYAPGFRARLEGHNDWVHITAFSPDGQMLLSGSEDGEVIVWDLSAGLSEVVRLHTLTGHRGQIIAAAFNAESTQAVTVDRGGTLIVWDVPNGQEINRVERKEDGEALPAAALTPDSTVVAYGLPNGAVALFLTAAADNTEIGRIEPHGGRIELMAFSADGVLLAVGTEDHAVTVWNTQTFQEIAQIEGHTSPVSALAFDSTSTRLVTAGSDGMVRLWDIATEETIRQYETTQEVTRSVSISPDNRQVLAASCVTGLNAWDMTTGTPIPLYDGEVATVGAASFSPDGHLAAFGNCPGGILPSRGGGMGDLILWSVSNGAVVRELGADLSALVALAYAPDGSAFSASEDGRVVHWDNSTGEMLQDWTIDGAALTSFALSAEGEQMLTGSADGVLTLTHTNGDDAPLTWRGHTGRVNALAFSPDGQTVASAGGDHHVILWDTASGERLRILGENSPDLTTWPFVVQFTNDGAQIITVTTQGRVAAWETATGAPVSQYEGVEGNFYLHGAALNPDNTILALVGNQPAAYVSDVEAGTLLNPMGTAASELRSAAFTPSGDRILFGTAEGVVSVWDMTERQPVRLLYAQSGSPVTALAVNPAGTEVLAGQADGSLTVWRLDSPAELVDWTARNRTVSEEVNQLAGDWYDLYFNAAVPDPDATEPGILEQAMIFAIQQATRSIDAAFFEINSPSVTEALLTAHAAGIDIRLVVDDEFTFEDEDSTITQLVDAGIPVVGDERSALMHHNFMVLDGGYLWISSTSPTTTAFKRSNVDAVLIQAQPVAAVFQEEFNHLFEDKAFSTRDQQALQADEGTSDRRSIVVNDAEFEVYLTPRDGELVEPRLIELVKSAKSSVRFLAFSFTLDELQHAMIDHLRSGVVVEGVFETTGSETEFSAMTPLACAHAMVRQDGNPYSMLHKVIIIDDDTVVTGTLNFSQNAVQTNNETMLVIHSRDIARAYHDEWRKIFEAARIPDIQAMDCEALAPEN